MRITRVEPLLISERASSLHRERVAISVRVSTPERKPHARRRDYVDNMLSPNTIRRLNLAPKPYVNLARPGSCDTGPEDSTASSPQGAGDRTVRCRREVRARCGPAVVARGNTRRGDLGV